MAAVISTGKNFTCAKCLKEHNVYITALVCCNNGKCVRCSYPAQYITVLGCLDGHIWHAEFCKAHWENAVLLWHNRELRCLDQSHEEMYPAVEEMIWRQK